MHIPDWSIKWYVNKEVKKLCVRLNLEKEFARQLQEEFSIAVDIALERMEKDKKKIILEPIPESRILLNTLGNLLVLEDSYFENPHHLKEMLAFMHRGGNVLLIQNHTSLADLLVFDTLISRSELGLISEKFLVLTGHIMYTFVVNAALSGAFRCVQLFSSRYKHKKKTGYKKMDFSSEEIDEQNERARGKIAELCEKGRQCIIMYPEGTRSKTGKLQYGDPKTSKITQIIADYSRNGFMIVPTFVMGSNQILPVLRGITGYARFIDKISANNCKIVCGKPVMWEEINPNEQEVEDYLNNNPSVELRLARRILLHERTMMLIAKLAPKELLGYWEKNI